MDNASVRVKPATLSFGKWNVGFWLVAIGAASWGIEPLFRVLLLHSLTSAQIVLLEHVIIGAVVLPILIKNRAELRTLKWKQLGALIFISWGGSAIATILFTQGLAMGGNLNALVLLQKLQPLFAIILARFLLKEILPKNFFPLFLVAIVGTYFLTFGFSLPIGHWSDFIQMGSLFSLGAAALWGGSTVMGRLLVGNLKYETVTALRFVVAIPLLLIITIQEGAAWNWPTASSELSLVLLNLFGQALLPGLLGLLIYYKGLTTTKASVATLAELSFPMVSVLMNWFIMDQVITWAQASGFVLIWLALFFISKKGQAKEPQLQLSVTSK
jgi:drug/metabolite transporter (DMT)-like permease